MKPSRGAGSAEESAGDRAEMLETLASVRRRSILDLLAREPSSVTEIARKVDLKPISVRFHLRKMRDLGLIEEVKQKGPVGRPRYLYRATKKQVEVGYPPRSYMQLASLLLGALAKNPDQQRVSKDIRSVGEKLGAGMGRSLKPKAPKWDALLLKEHFVEGVLEDFGAEPESVKVSKNSIQYRVNNCPFRELAVKYPQVVCEQLDDTVNASLLRELDRGIDWRKLRCVGYGDSYCEYLATFPEK